MARDGWPFFVLFRPSGTRGAKRLPGGAVVRPRSDPLAPFSRVLRHGSLPESRDVLVVYRRRRSGAQSTHWLRCRAHSQLLQSPEEHLQQGFPHKLCTSLLRALAER